MSDHVASTAVPREGDKRGYNRVHIRARKLLRGQACAHCGSTGPIQAALRPATPVERLSIFPEHGCAYSDLAEDYDPLCAPCHYRQDHALRTHCRRGHEYTEANTAVGKGGSRRCRACNRASSQRATSAGRRPYIPTGPLTDEQRARKAEAYRRWAAKPGVRERRTEANRRARAAARDSA